MAQETECSEFREKDCTVVTDTECNTGKGECCGFFLMFNINVLVWKHIDR